MLWYCDGKYFFERVAGKLKIILVQDERFGVKQESRLLTSFPEMPIQDPSIVSSFPS